MKDTRKTKRIRISVPVSNELDEKIYKVAEQLSISKSSLCALLISQGVIQKQTELELTSTANLNKIMQEQIEKKKAND